MKIMKKILFTFLLLLSITVFSQKKIFFDATIVSMKGDTIKSKIMIFNFLFSQNEIDFRPLLSYATLVDDDGKIIQKISSQSISKVIFNDIKGVERTFVNNGIYLKELKYEGIKYKWFIEYSINGYDGGLMSNGSLIDRNNKTHKFVRIAKGRKILLELNEHPEYIEEINSIKNYNDIAAVLKKIDF